MLLVSAGVRMTLYVEAYGLSFKRFLTYWGMGMMAAFLLAAAWKVHRPDFRFCRVVFPLALAGWLVINCVPVDYLVAKDQVDRYLAGESAALDVEYLLYDLSYDTLAQLRRLDGAEIFRCGSGSVSAVCIWSTSGCRSPGGLRRLADLEPVGLAGQPGRHVREVR